MTPTFSSVSIFNSIQFGQIKKFGEVLEKLVNFQTSAENVLWAEFDRVPGIGRGTRNSEMKKPKNVLIEWVSMKRCFVLFTLEYT